MVRRHRTARLSRYTALRTLRLTKKAAQPKPAAAAPIVWYSAAARRIHQFNEAWGIADCGPWSDLKTPPPTEADVEAIVKTFKSKWEKELVTNNGPFEFCDRKRGIELELGRVQQMGSAELQCNYYQATIQTVYLSPAWQRKGLLRRIIHVMLNSTVAKLEAVQIQAIRNPGWLNRMTREAQSPNGYWRFIFLAHDDEVEGETRDSFVRLKDAARDSDLKTFKFYSDSK